MLPFMVNEDEHKQTGVQLQSQKSTLEVNLQTTISETFII